MSRLVSVFLHRCWAVLILVGVAACSPSAVSTTGYLSPPNARHIDQSGETGGVQSMLASYSESERYVVFDIDINMDGQVDKVISSSRNMGEELILFVRDGGVYREALRSINLAEDGGRVFDRVDPIAPGSSMREVFSITNFFPKGEDVAVHYVAYEDGGWELSRTVYTVADWRQNAGQRHRCEVEQGIALQDLKLEEGIAKFKTLPETSHRDDVCERI